MSDRQRIRSTRRSAILGAAALACALLVPGASALESDPAPKPPAPAAADGDSASAPTGRTGGAAANGSARSVRQRGAAAPVELRPRPEPTPAAADKSAASDTARDDAGSSAGTAKEHGRATKSKHENPSRVWPLEKGDFSFTQPFGCVPQLGGFYRTNPGCPADSPAVHGGIDLAAAQGTRIYAAASGWVTEAGLDREVGLANTRLIVQHDGENEGYATEYLHWITSYVRVGDYVRAGEPIAEVGSVGWSTGPHLHFAVIEFDTGEYADPVQWLPKATGDGVYRGLEPGRRPQRFEHASANMPEHADPAPPPAPTRERVPESPPADAGGTQGGKSKDERAKRQRKAERRAEKRTARETRAEAGPGGRHEIAPDDTAGDAPVDSGDTDAGAAGDSSDAVAVKERQRDRAAAAERDGRKRNDKNENRDGASDRGGGKDKRDRNKDKGSGKGDVGRNDGNGDGGKKDGKGGKNDGRDSGKQRDKDAGVDDGSTPPTTDSADEPTEPVDEPTDSGANDDSGSDDSATHGGDASDQVAAPLADDATGGAPATDQEPTQRKKQRRAETESAA